MKPIQFIFQIIFLFGLLMVMGCSSKHHGHSHHNSGEYRGPWRADPADMPSTQGRRHYTYSRSGRTYREPKAMNHRRVDTDSLFEACLREWPELYCRNRMGR